MSRLLTRMELETVVALLVSDQEIDLASKLNYHQAQNMLQVPSVPKVYQS
ncbi:hypothetical protein V6Z11_D03G020200 [Gossypium hirsutum]